MGPLGGLLHSCGLPGASGTRDFAGEPGAAAASREGEELSLGTYCSVRLLARGVFPAVHSERVPADALARVLLSELLRRQWFVPVSAGGLSIPVDLSVSAGKGYAELFVTAELPQSARAVEVKDVLTRLEHYTRTAAVAAWRDVAGTVSPDSSFRASDNVHLNGTGFVVTLSALDSLQGVLVCEFLPH